MFFLQKSKFIIIPIVLLMIILPTVASAVQFPTLIPTCAQGTYNKARNIYEQKEAPTLNCAVELLGNVAKMILAISGVLVLVMFIYGGFLWLTSGGSSDKITQGKKIMVGTVIGLAIIFGANLAITFIQTTFGIQKEFLSPAKVEESKTGAAAGCFSYKRDGGSDWACVNGNESNRGDLESMYYLVNWNKGKTCTKDFCQ